MRQLLILTVFVLLKSTLFAQSEQTFDRFVSIDFGAGKVFQSEFRPNSRGAKFPPFYEGTPLTNTLAASISGGKFFTDKLAWMIQVDYKEFVGELYCICLSCDKISIFTEVNVHQMGASSGIRWMLLDKSKWDISLDALTGIRLDINQNAAIPWFFAIQPRLSYSFLDRHALGLRNSYSANITGYKEHILVTSLGYQFSF